MTGCEIFVTDGVSESRCGAPADVTIGKGRHRANACRSHADDLAPYRWEALASGADEMACLEVLES